MNLSENLKMIRKENNLSQEQLAEKLGVSRQSVSKWESNQAYPEIDKIIQICNIFNININDLLNNDIKKIEKTKKSQLNINKYIDDFLDYITKTINMLSSMNFKQKIKCIIEQIIIIFILLILFLILGSALTIIIDNIINHLPYHIYTVVNSILSSLYLITCLIIGIILLLHIFKIRYLDYYIIETPMDKEKDNISNEENKIYFEKKKERIIIRDPKHSNYKFIKGLIKCFIIFIKTIIIFILGGLCFSFVSLIMSLILSFLILKTGLFFIGIFFSLLSCIVLNILLIVILYNFLINKKSNKQYIIRILISSLIVLGFGIGFIIIGVLNFNYINNTNNKYFIKNEKVYEMKDNLIIDTYYNIEYIENDNNDIKIVYEHTKYYNVEFNLNYKYTSYGTKTNYEDITIHSYQIDDNIINNIRSYIKDINDNNIVNYSKLKIYIYTSKENINKLKNNKNKFYQIDNQEIRLNDKIDELQQEIIKKDDEINNLKEQLN